MLELHPQEVKSCILGLDGVDLGVLAVTCFGFPRIHEHLLYVLFECYTGKDGRRVVV